MPKGDIALLEAGEATGNLDRTLDRIADRHEARRAARRRFLTQSLYPLILFHLAAFLTPVPGAFARDGQRLFGPTWLASFLAVLVPFYALLFGAAWLRRTARGRAFLRRVVDAIPGFGSAVRHRARADVAEVLGASYEAGMTLDRGLALAGHAVEDGRVEAAASDVARGRTLHDALVSAGALPAPLLARIATGERAGELSRVFSEIAREEADTADHILSRSTQVASKVLYVAVALWILYYVVSTYARIYSFAL